MVGYKGPIYMTVPTKAIAPILLEDMRKVAVDRKGDSFFHLKC
jgi:integrator complex subunit 11